MSRYIDADALLDDVFERYCKECAKRKGSKNGKYRIIYEVGDPPCRACDIDDMKTEIEDAPTIEPERKKGRWVWNPDGMDFGLGAWCCSECKAKTETWWANDERYNPLRCSGGNFCGVCGADMRGEQE